jgi:hypothetical protein
MVSLRKVYIVCNVSVSCRYNREPTVGSKRLSFPFCTVLALTFYRYIESFYRFIFPGLGECNLQFT